MKVLAFDQASIKTGFAVFEDITLTGYGVIDLSKEKSAAIRAGAMITEMYALIEEHKPDAIVMEDVAMQRNVATLVTLARLQGALMAYCYQHNVAGSIFKSSEWRKLLQFKQGNKVPRARLKQQAQEFVEKGFGLQVSEDEADAICIGVAYTAPRMEVEK